MHQHTHPHSHQHVPDDITDYGPLIRAWQILPEIDVPRPSAGTTFHVFSQTIAGKPGGLVSLGAGSGGIAGISSGT